MVVLSPGPNGRKQNIRWWMVQTLELLQWSRVTGMYHCSATVGTAVLHLASMLVDRDDVSHDHLREPGPWIPPRYATLTGAKSRTLSTIT